MATQATSVSLAGNVLISQALQDFRTSVDSFIKGKVSALKSAILTLELSAAREVELAIENTRIAYDYRGFLKLTVEKVDVVVKSQLETLLRMVADLKSLAAIPTLSSRVDQYIRSLPLANWQPKVTGICPSYAFIDKDLRLKISFSGWFEDAANCPNGCRLTLNNIAHKVHETGLSRLTFKATLSKEEIANSENHWIKGRLQVPYNVGWVRNVYTMAEYEVWIVATLGPGKITLTTPKSEVVNVIKRQFKSATLSLSRKDFPTESLVERDHQILPSRGWKFSGTPKIHLTAAGVLQNHSSDHVSVKLSLLPGEKEVQAQVECEEMQEVMGEKNTDEVIPLRWGGMYSFKAASFTAKLERFDGEMFTFTGADESQPYLKVVKKDEWVSLVATLPPTF